MLRRRRSDGPGGPRGHRRRTRQHGAGRRSTICCPRSTATVLTLRELQGSSYGRDRRAVLKVSLGTVESRLHRARERLKRRLTNPCTVIRTFPKRGLWRLRRQRGECRRGVRRDRPRRPRPRTRRWSAQLDEMTRDRRREVGLPARPNRRPISPDQRGCDRDARTAGAAVLDLERSTPHRSGAPWWPPPILAAARPFAYLAVRSVVPGPRMEAEPVQAAPPDSCGGKSADETRSNRMVLPHGASALSVRGRHSAPARSIGSLSSAPRRKRRGAGRRPDRPHPRTFREIGSDARRFAQVRHASGCIFDDAPVQRSGACCGRRSSAENDAAATTEESNMTLCRQRIRGDPARRTSAIGVRQAASAADEMSA